MLPIYDALFRQNRLRHILVRHEQAAVHAAEGYARSTGRVGCVLVTSGPGATNAVTGLTDALMDSVPLVCLTGQVPTHLIGNDAFQEADTVGITRPCTKHNYLVKDVRDLARILAEAFHVAAAGRPGPVVVDLPKDVVNDTCDYAPPDGPVVHKTYRPPRTPDSAAVAEAAALLAGAKRPIIYAGGGVINSGAPAVARLRELVRATGFPVTQTLMGLGAYPATGRQALGMVGMHGTYESNMAMHDCDVMLAVGARFDDRVTGRLTAFSPESRKIHIDIDPSSINKNVAVDVALIGDAGEALAALLDEWARRRHAPDRTALAAWWRRIEDWRAVDCLRYDADAETISRSTPSSACRRPPPAARSASPPRSASTRCGRRSSSRSRSRCAG